MNVLARQFSLFTLVGGFATLIQYAVLIALVKLGATNPVQASMAGYAAGAFVNYALNRAVTFPTRLDHRETLWRFIAVASVGFALNGAIMSFTMSALHAHYLVAQTGSTIIVLVWNFVGNRYWTFQGARPPPGSHW